jgi:hypothetical protein
MNKRYEKERFESISLKRSVAKKFWKYGKAISKSQPITPLLMLEFFDTKEIWRFWAFQPYAGKYVEAAHECHYSHHQEHREESDQTDYRHNGIPLFICQRGRRGSTNHGQQEIQREPILRTG